MSPPIQSDTFIPDDNGPLIAVLSQPRIVETSLDGSTLVIEYTIRQSESQSDVVSIKKFMDNTFRSCSMFINGSFPLPFCYWIETCGCHLEPDSVTGCDSSC